MTNGKPAWQRMLCTAPIYRRNEATMTFIPSVVAATLVTFLLIGVPAQAQFTPEVIDSTPQPCAAQVGAPPDGLLCDADGLIVHAPDPDNLNPEKTSIWRWRRHSSERGVVFG